MNGFSIDGFRKDLIGIFKEFGLNVIISMSLLIANFLHRTLVLNTSKQPSQEHMLESIYDCHR